MVDLSDILLWFSSVFLILLVVAAMPLSFCCSCIGVLVIAVILLFLFCFGVGRHGWTFLLGCVARGEGG